MNTAEWILVIFLSSALLIFLVLAIILTAKLIGLTNEAKKVVEKGQSIADKTDDIVGNVRTYTTVGGVANTLGSVYNIVKGNKKTKKGKHDQK